jgi:3-phosphoshikimate 1-carboxyvinyltransferase
VSSAHVKVPTGPLSATVVVPGSKSVANRALVCALLADGESVISDVPTGDDTHVLLDVAEEMGRLFRVGDTTVAIRGSSEVRLPGIIDARLAGTSSRFLTALAALGDATCIVDGEEPLRMRPMSDLHDALSLLGAEVSCLGELGHLPVSVSRGQFQGGTVSIRGDVSSQFISALMLVSPVLAEGLCINIAGDLVSRSYVEMTARVMQEFGASVEVTNASIIVRSGGYNARDFSIEPDYSSAAFALIAPVLRQGSVTVPNLELSKLQGDAEVIDIAKEMGLNVVIEGTDITVSRSSNTVLRPIDRDMSNCSDLVPAVAVACLGINGVSRIRGVGFIRHKESDRLGDLAHEMTKTGASIEALEDGLVINGGHVLSSATVETHHDHRLAMALSLLGLVTDEIVINNHSVVTKSWPQYFSAMSSILGQTVIGK